MRSTTTDANFLAGTFMDYLMPTAMEIPTIEIEHIYGSALAEVNSRGVARAARSRPRRRSPTPSPTRSEACGSPRCR